MLSATASVAAATARASALAQVATAGEPAGGESHTFNNHHMYIYQHLTGRQPLTATRSSFFSTQLQQLTAWQDEVVFTSHTTCLPSKHLFAPCHLFVFTHGTVNLSCNDLIICCLFRLHCGSRVSSLSSSECGEWSDITGGSGHPRHSGLIAGGQ